jgi:hypothetical protein
MIIPRLPVPQMAPSQMTIVAQRQKVARFQFKFRLNMKRDNVMNFKLARCAASLASFLNLQMLGPDASPTA